MIRRLAAILCFALLAGYACISAAADADAVVLQLPWKHRFEFAGYYAAEAYGFYRQAGLDVTIREADAGTPDPVNAVLAGKADFGIAASDLVLRRARGDPVIALAVIMQHSPLELVTLAKREFRAPADLAGKRVMILDRESEIFAYLAKAGISATQITTVPHDFGLDSLFSGKVDAVTASATDAMFLAQRRQQPISEWSPESLGIDFYGDTLFTSESQVRLHDARVRSFREASLRGWQYAMAHPGEIIQMMQNRFGHPLDAPQLAFEAEQMRRLMQPDLIEIGHMNPSRWQRIADVYVQLGMLPKDASLEGLVYHDVDDRSERAWLIRSLIGSLLVLALVLPFTWRMRQLNRRMKLEVAERQQAEALLRTSEDRMRKLLDISPDGIITTDPEGRITYFSAKQAEIVGAPANANVIGHLVYDWFHPEDRDLAKARMQRQMRGETMSPRAFRLLKYDGGMMWGEIASALIQDGSGSSEGLLIIVRDINERKFLEEALHRTNESLLAQIQETNRLQDQLREQVVRDPLTGLYNRRYLDETLDREISRASRENYPLCIAIIDLDHFKNVNDTYGHQSGDEVLKTLGKLLRGSARGGDIACRWGGEEFMLVLPRMTAETAQQRTEQWRNAFAELRFPFSAQHITVTLSVGIAAFPVHGKTATTLTQNADVALYLAKAQGRNRVVVFTPA
jgi:diguanylate cyclase (GGDEF)-like protein/PAS domain S-box-containing protein